MRLHTLFFTFMIAAGATAAPLLTLDPASGQVTGTPGSRTGFGFTLVNDTDYLVFQQVQFVPDAAPLPFEDFASEDFRVVGPSEGATWSEAFNLPSRAGLGAFMIPAGANGGDTFAGEIRVYYDLFSVSPNDPSFDPGAHEVALGQFVAARANLLVSAPAAGVPEPGTLGLTAFVLVVALTARHRGRVFKSGDTGL
jgi:hypothetical protein